jgi:hypothetical protein
LIAIPVHQKKVIVLHGNSREVEKTGMKVLVYNRKGFARYIPLTKGTGGYDYNINQKIMPECLYKKIEKRSKRLKGNRDCDFTLPIGFNQTAALNCGCIIVVVDKDMYEAKKDEIVK